MQPTQADIFLALLANPKITDPDRLKSEGISWDEHCRALAGLARRTIDALPRHAG